MKSFGRADKVDCSFGVGRRMTSPGILIENFARHTAPLLGDTQWVLCFRCEGSEHPCLSKRLCQHEATIAVKLNLPYTLNEKGWANTMLSFLVTLIAISEYKQAVADKQPQLSGTQSGERRVF
jgi:hypothetical protein